MPHSLYSHTDGLTIHLQTFNFSKYFEIVFKLVHGNYGQACKLNIPILSGFATGLVERLRDGESVIIAEGYMWEFERRGYLKLGAQTPEVVIEHPEMVISMHKEFVHAGSDVVEAFTVSLYNRTACSDLEGVWQYLENDRTYSNDQKHNSFKRLSGCK